MNAILIRLSELSYSFHKLANLIKWLFIGLLVDVFSKNKEDNKSVENFTPIFILGHWRSGTTFLQKLLCASHDIQYISVADVTTSPCSPMVSKIVNTLTSLFFRMIYIEDKFQRTRFTTDMPMEEMHATMFNKCYDTSSWAFIFPQKAIDFFDTYLFSAFNESQKRMDVQYKIIIDKIARKKRNLRYLIIKSPENTSRIERILTLYPNAKFIYIHRDPYDVFHSCQFFWDIVASDFSVQELKADIKTQIIQHTYTNSIRIYLETRGLISKGNLVEVNYETLRATPIETIKYILQKVELQDEISMSGIEAYINKAEVREYKVNTYKQDEATQKQIRVIGANGYNLWNELNVIHGSFPHEP